VAGTRPVPTRDRVCGYRGQDPASGAVDNPLTAAWPTARIVRGLDELRAFKAQPEGAVYVVGGAGLVRSLLDEGLLDELRLIIHPVAVGAGAALFDGIAQRQDLELLNSGRTAAGRLTVSYRVTASTLSHAQ
jgi:dihydrofolate reductase